ncbi:MAG: ATP-dependent zinc protease [Gammaproteobacteria bacterium]|nr:ATP-dependent zinc protease [Gammaproteobacteria bacterium]
MTTPPEELLHVGWREWCSLPELGLPNIKAKIDTGARTSCLHAFELQTFREGGALWVRFGVHPVQKKSKLKVYCQTPVIDQRMVSDSGGHREKRFVIQTMLALGGQQWPIEMTLTNRDTMLFRMLLGRTAMEQRILVQPGASFLQGRPDRASKP